MEWEPWFPIYLGVSGGFSPHVLALAVSGSNVYVGGSFTRAGGSDGTNIAKWSDASGWSTIGLGVGGTVSALAVSGSNVYAGGWFMRAGGNAANYVAKWNGSSWSPLGSGMNSSVYSLAISDSHLYAGGGFSIAGGKISPGIARAYLERPTLSILRSATDLTLSWPTFYESFALQQNPNAANTNTWSNATYPLTTNGPTKTATASPPPTTSSA